MNRAQNRVKVLARLSFFLIQLHVSFSCHLDFGFSFQPIKDNWFINSYTIYELPEHNRYVCIYMIEDMLEINLFLGGQNG